MLNEQAYRRLRSRLAIDNLRVDDELMEIPGLVMEAAENVAEAMQIRDNCKNRLDLITANATMRLREVPVSIDGKPPKSRTESSINDEKLTIDAVQEALAELEVCKYDLALWNGLLDSLKEKSNSIRRIAELMMGGFLTSAQVYQERRAAIAQVRQEKAAEGPVLRRR